MSCPCGGIKRQQIALRANDWRESRGTTVQVAARFVRSRRAQAARVGRDRTAGKPRSLRVDIEPNVCARRSRVRGPLPFGIGWCAWPRRCLAEPVASLQASPLLRPASRWRCSRRHAARPRTKKPMARPSSWAELVSRRRKLPIRLAPRMAVHRTPARPQPRLRRRPRAAAAHLRAVPRAVPARSRWVRRRSGSIPALHRARALRVRA